VNAGRAGLLLRKNKTYYRSVSSCGVFDFICGQRFNIFVWDDRYRARTLKYYLGPRDDDTHSVEFCQSGLGFIENKKKNTNKQYNTGRNVIIIREYDEKNVRSPRRFFGSFFLFRFYS